MLFSSIPFLFGFLPIVLIGYRLLPKSWRNVWLLFSSLIFYMWGGGAFVFILIGSSIVDFAAGRLAFRGRVEGNRTLVRVGVVGSVAVNLSLLSYFKYANFAVDQLNGVTDWLGVAPVAWTGVALPIGISFYTFQSMSYTIDIASGRATPLRRFPDFLLYVSLFPQLIAGPIVRFHEIAGELGSREETASKFAQGALRFSHGLVKKVIIADAVSVIVDIAFSSDPSMMTMTDAWVGLVAYTIQIYFDFSGYSDMAIGLGLMFGFRFPENFRRPYSAVSVTDFWRRWHITLSNWFRDYVYIPLGGSRGGSARVYMNLITVFLLTGLWHGADWTFVVWGAYHGVLMLVERVSGIRPVGDSSVSRAWLRRTVVLLAVMLGWVVFRAPSLGAAVDYFGVLFGGPIAGLQVVQPAMSTRALIGLGIGISSFFLPRDFVMGPILADVTRSSPWVAAARWAVLVPGFVYSVIVIAGGSFSPFLYFQF